jgi:hypothetical protein
VTIQKSGLFQLNHEAAEALSLAEGHKVSLVRNKEKPKDWYILRDASGVDLRKSSQGFLIFSAKIVRDLMIDAIQPKNPTMRFRVASQPERVGDKMLYAILTTKTV